MKKMTLTCTGKTCTDCKSYKKSFTLIELLIVIAIIAILAGMLLPALGQAKKAVEKAVCSSNQKQTLMLHASYNNNYNEYIVPNILVLSNDDPYQNPSGMLLLLENGGFFRGVGARDTFTNPGFIFCPSTSSWNTDRTRGFAIDSANQIVKRNMVSYMSKLGTFNCGYMMTYENTVISGIKTYGQDGHQVVQYNEPPLYMTRVKKPSKKAWLCETSGTHFSTGAIPAGFGHDYSAHIFAAFPAEAAQDLLTGRHLKTQNLGYLDGHVEAMTGTEVYKNRKDLLGNYYD